MNTCPTFDTVTLKEKKFARNDRICTKTNTHTQKNTPNIKYHSAQTQHSYHIKTTESPNQANTHTPTQTHTHTNVYSKEKQKKNN